MIGKHLFVRVVVTLGLVAMIASITPAGAVVILDSTWRSEGGTKKRPWAGFGAHVRLAADPRFLPVLALSTDGETWGEASGTWIGNDASHAYILTAAHIFDLPASASEYVARGADGRILRPDRLWLHPGWTGDIDNQTGVDMAVLRVPRPLTDLGPQPALYAGAEERGKLITFVGYGSRGIGSSGEDEAYDDEAADKAAAQGVVDDWTRLRTNPKRGVETGGYLTVFLPKEDGSIENPWGGSDRPATRLAGLLGSGDSGGSAWMPVGGGELAIAGVASSGDGSAGYGDSSWFSRVSVNARWISSVFPGARFTR